MTSDFSDPSPTPPHSGEVLLPASDPAAVPTVSPESRLPDEFDRRVYIPEPEGWKAHIKLGWDNDYCYAKSPGQDYFHLLLNGEVFIQKEHEKFCLNCAVRLGLVTTDRLYWQNGPRPPRPTPM